MIKQVQREKSYESNSDSNICTVLHLPFCMLCYFLRMEMIPCNMEYYKSQCYIMPLASLLWLIP